MFKFSKFTRSIPIGFAGMVLSLSITLPVNADTTKVRCDFYPKGEDRASLSTSCTFSQRQGFIGIQKPDGTRYDFKPKSNQPNSYTDQKGQTVTKEMNGDIGLIFRTAKESIYIFWDDSSGSGQGEDPNTMCDPTREPC